MRLEGLGRFWLALAALSGASAVIAGAYGAHHSALSQDAGQWLDKASRYQMYHALALLAVALLQRRGARFTALAGALFGLGSLFFCGALYALALFDVPAAPLVPIGGTAFILGWVSLAVSAVVDKGR